MAMNIKKGDTIVVLSGKDKGKQGKVLGTVPKSTKIVAEGINMVTCHVKPRRQGEEGRHRQARGCHRRLQGAGCLPQVQQGYPRCSQDRGRQEDPRVQALRCRNCKKGAS